MANPFGNIEDKEQRRVERLAAEGESVECPECGTENPDGAKFCSECGTDLTSETQTIVCPKCGHENVAGVKFCNECGESLGAERQKKAYGETVWTKEIGGGSGGTGGGGQASAGLKNAILLIILVFLLGGLILGLITCGGCLAAFGG